MRDRNRAVRQAIPVTTSNDGDEDPDLLPISDEDSVDSSLYSRDSESEGGIWDNPHNDDVSIAPEGAQLIPPNDLIPPDDFNREPLVGSPIGHNIGPDHETTRPVPNLVPVPIQAPEGAYQRRRGKAKQYPPAVW
jgi:hypothetical protein